MAARPMYRFKFGGGHSVGQNMLMDRNMARAAK
jgi:hypothetical protein